MSIADLLAAAAAAGSDGTAAVAALQQRIAQLHIGLEQRTTIGRVVGMLMVAMPAGADTAFATLRHLSMETHRKVRDVAALIEQHFTTGSVLPADLAGSLRHAVGAGPAQQARRLP
jgi:AmiR/NasT family two-component response regulator